MILYNLDYIKLGVLHVQKCKNQGLKGEIK